jgi:hypothetical protein
MYYHYKSCFVVSQAIHFEGIVTLKVYYILKANEELQFRMAECINSTILKSEYIYIYIVFTIISRVDSILKDSKGR